MNIGDRFGQVSRKQLAVAGATGGYALGLLAGPVVKGLSGLVLMFAFYFVGKHLDDKFETTLGYVGVAAAILATYLLEPVRHALTGAIGNAISHTSSFLLAGTGAFVAVRIYDRLADDPDIDTY